MKHLSIDIETFSDVDIKKSGLFKYCESPVFELLLFAYAYDFGDAHVVDLAQGEKIPDSVISDLNNPEVIKHAYNAHLKSQGSTATDMLLPRSSGAVQCFTVYILAIRRGWFS